MDLEYESLKPVKGRRLSTLIVDQLQQLILSGALPPGARFPSERVLIDKFQTSRSSVLEALHILDVLGLTEIRRGATGGTFVAKPDFRNFGPGLQQGFGKTPFTMGDVYEARVVLEPAIARRAAEVARPEDIKMLRQCLAYHERTPREQHAAIGRNFDYLLAKVSGNPVLATMMSSLFGAIQAHRTKLSLLPRTERLAAQREVVDAIEAGDGALAAARMEAYLRRIHAQVVEKSATSLADAPLGVEPVKPKANGSARARMAAGATPTRRKPSGKLRKDGAET